MVAFAPFVLFLNFGLHHLRNPWVLSGIVISFLLAAGVTGYVHFRYLREWPRFSAKPVSPIFSIKRKS
jgi:hypothetical protein